MTLPGIIAIAILAIVALAVHSFTGHFLFTPRLLAAIAIVAWIKIPASPLPPVAPSAPYRGHAGRSRRIITDLEVGVLLVSAVESSGMRTLASGK